MIAAPLAVLWMEPKERGPRVGLPPTEGIAVEDYDRLKKLVADAEEDIKKAEGGNKAAGTRARQTMQEIKNTAQNVREKILELRTTGDQTNPA
jgi:hypothetical protein